MNMLRSVEGAPRSLPQWSQILDDLGSPDVFAVSKVLGVDPVFVDDWNRRGAAPKWACLALFWLTRWGQAMVSEKSERDCQLAMACLSSVERDRDELLAQLGRPPAPPLLASSKVDGWHSGTFRQLEQASKPHPWRSSGSRRRR
jgi:hypothetical protein